LQDVVGLIAMTHCFLELKLILVKQIILQCNSLDELWLEYFLHMFCDILINLNASVQGKIN
jgi:hypothetical protein